MRVLFVASEIYPYVKTGGLGDVVGALPPELIKHNVDVRLLLPAYGEILDSVEKVTTLKTLSGPLYSKKGARILACTLADGVKVYLLDIEGYYDRPNPYVDKAGKDWPDNHLRFAALCYAAAHIADWENDWVPDIIHGHDWHCGLIPAYLRQVQGPKPATVATIHNIAYQGIFPRRLMAELALPADTYNINGLEYYGQISFLKSGLYYSDAITTVSPQYAKEIQLPEYGCGMQDVLKIRSVALQGILNGIDPDVWNPSTDPHIAGHYNGRTLKEIRNKAACRAALLAQCKLNLRSKRMVFGVVSRLVEQKGLDVLLDAMQVILQQGAGLAVLGAGDAELEEGFTRLAKEWPSQVFVFHGYDETLAHRIIAGVDCIIVPSRFEPCGLVQLYGLRYGTLPLVRRTGGLADTVIDNKDKSASTGFVFDNLTVPELAYTMQRAINTYNDKTQWAKLQKNAMAQNFGWSRAAGEYKVLYKSLTKSRT
ncbi:MAG: glycogen/starch synthase, ADP-glucose type [Micavibrio sp.]|nr:glycogen/starch synthase, ADP-glucose type [Micavibrio sp.]